MDKILRDKAFNIAKNPNYDEYQEGLPLWFTDFLIKRLQAVVLICMQIMKNKLRNYTHQLLKIFRKELFIQDLKTLFGVLIYLICNFDKGFRFLFCVIDVFSKRAWAVPLKDKKGVSIVNLFSKNIR